MISELLEVLLKERLQPQLKTSKSFQVHFRNEHWTMEVTSRIRKDLEVKSTAFQMSLRLEVWYDSLLYKLWKLLPVNLFCIFKSYLEVVLHKLPQEIIFCYAYCTPPI